MFGSNKHESHAQVLVFALNFLLSCSLSVSFFLSSLSSATFLLFFLSSAFFFFLLSEDDPFSLEGKSLSEAEDLLSFCFLLLFAFFFLSLALEPLLLESLMPHVSPSSELCAFYVTQCSARFFSPFVSADTTSASFFGFTAVSSL